MFLIPWTSTPAINRGDATNRLGVHALGPEVTILANGQVVGCVHDDTWQAGLFSIGVGGPPAAAVTARYSHLVITTAE